MYSKNDLERFLKSEVSNPITIAELKEKINNTEKKDFINLKNISLSQLTRLINKMVRVKRINFISDRSIHPKRFPVKMYFINFN